jgi:hypothetical protein
MLRTLLALLSFAAAAPAQDPATDCAAALLRGDAAGAARAAAVPASLAARARLQAALLPLEPRPAAMLAVAQAFPGDPEADEALLAGAAAVLLVLGRHEVLPELAQWTDVANEGLRYAPHTSALEPVVLGLRDAVAARLRQGGDPVRMQHAQRLLDIACVSRFGLWPARVARDAVWERPPGLEEDLQLCALPCAPGGVAWTQLTTLGAPAWQTTMPQAGAMQLPPLPPGSWLLEARSTASPWRGVRVVEVSDLDGWALAAGDAMVLAAFDHTGPVATRWQLRATTGEVARGDPGAAPAVEHRHHGVDAEPGIVLQPAEHARHPGAAAKTTDIQLQETHSLIILICLRSQRLCGRSTRSCARSSAAVCNRLSSTEFTRVRPGTAMRMATTVTVTTPSVPCTRLPWSNP